MIAMREPTPWSWPRLFTVDEYFALGETEPGYTELHEGRIVLSPTPTPHHNMVGLELCGQLDSQLPDDLEVIWGVDIDLELAPADRPGFSRRPDLVIVDMAARPRVRDEGGILRASEVRVAIEIVSPDSRRTDNVIKHAEYAEAGIPRYWTVELDALSLRVWRLADGCYRDAGTFADRCTLDDPRVDLDMTALRRSVSGCG